MKAFRMPFTCFVFSAILPYMVALAFYAGLRVEPRELFRFFLPCPKPPFGDGIGKTEIEIIKNILVIYHTEKNMKLLMHMCCGPCSCYPLKKLRADAIEPVGYFFNPNIHPYKEWDLRLKTAKEFADRTGMEIRTEKNFMLRDFLRRALAAEDAASASGGKDTEDGMTFAERTPDSLLGTAEDARRYVDAYAARRQARCRMCYTWRLEEAARYASEHGFEAFTSTLFYSIYQQHELMKETANRAAQHYGIKFYYEDFRVGWQEGIDISLDLGLYRQSYCGCVFSEEERYSRAMQKARKKAGRAMKAERLGIKIAE